MIQSIEVTNYLGESLKIDLGTPEEWGIWIKSIKGLGPGKANINTTDLASSDGGIFNSARSEIRNIVLTLGFITTTIDGEFYSVEDVRNLTYKYFPKKKIIRLVINTDRISLITYGYVESNEPEIFSKDETTQISIICPDPLLYSAYINQTVFNGVDFEFEFPFENDTVGQPITLIPGLGAQYQEIVDELPESGDPNKSYFVKDQVNAGWFTEYRYLGSAWHQMGYKKYDQPDIEFGSIMLLKERSIWYDGDTEIGVVISIHAIGQATNITIYNTGTRESMRIDTDKIAALVGSGIGNGDEITISTVEGNKYINLLRNGVNYNILNALDKDADWFQLAKGDNVFTFVADYGASNLQFRILNQIAYEGV